MKKLDDSVSTIADDHLHAPIRSTEALPTGQQIDVGPLLDVLLAEIGRVLKPSAGQTTAGSDRAADVQQP
jgi:hypothetical protein